MTARREALAGRLSEVLGVAEAQTLMEYLLEDPTAIGNEVTANGRRLDGVETRLDGVETRLGRVETRLDGVETRLGRVETRLDSIETRLDGMERRFDTMENHLARLDARLDSLYQLVVQQGSDTGHAIVAQTRTFVLSTTASVISAAGLAFVAARFL